MPIWEIEVKSNFNYFYFLRYVEIIGSNIPISITEIYQFNKFYTYAIKQGKLIVNYLFIYSIY